MEDKQQRSADIDALRGFAALSVVVFHLWQIAPGGQLPLAWWMTPFQHHLGSAGVPLFFALSAFLLTSMMPRYLQGPRPLLSFYTRRFARIAPLFYVVTLLGAAYAASIGSPYGADDILWTLSLAFNLVPEYANTPVFAGWSIGVEVLFYAIFPLVYLLTRDWRLVAAACCLSLVADAIFVQLVADMSPSNYRLIGFPSRLPVFLMGMLVFLAHERLSARPDKRRIGLLLVGVSAVLGTAVVSGRASLILSPDQWRDVAVALFLLGYLLCPLRFARPFTSFLGRVSYSTYLLHGPVILLMGTIFRDIYAWVGIADIAYPLCVLLAMAVILPVSYASYRVIELPGIALGNRLVALWRGRSPALSGSRAS